MEFTVRKLVYEDYDDTLLGWWSAWGMTAPKREFLQDNGEGGVVVFDGDVPVCAGFMYTTNSGIAWIDWVITSTGYRGKELRKNALDILIATLSSVAKDAGFSYVYTLFKNNRLIDYFERAGFTQSAQYTGEMIKRL